MSNICQQKSAELNENTTFSFPSPEILKKPFLLKEALTLSSWNRLVDNERSHLLKLLPASLTKEEKEETVRSLFDGSDLIAFSEARSHHSSGNPLDDLIEKLQKGYYSSEMCWLRKCKRKAMKEKNQYEKSHYYHELLKEMIISRQCHLSAITFPKSFKLVKHKVLTPNVNVVSKEKMTKGATEHYFSVLKDVKQKLIMSHNCAEEELLSSDTDSEHDAHPLLLEKQIVPNPLVSTASIKELLIQHKRRRTANVHSPDLNVNGVKLVDVISRTFGTTRKGTGLLKKRKRDDTLKLSRQKRLKTSKMDRERKSFAVKEKKTITTPSCYFELIRDVIQLASDKTTSSIRLLISDWLSSADASRYDWTSQYTNWIDMLQSALMFLSTKQVEQISGLPFIRRDDDKLSWNISHLTKKEEDPIIKTLCEEWIQEISDQLLLPTFDRDGPSSFHSQERRRFSFAHQAFVYSIRGMRYPVPPVKGTVGPAKEGRVAREHCLLKSERPPQVTLLALARDAVARLPDGRGTRSLVCTILRESQYLAPGITEAQINAAVSGALDRLHYENDPCVKYDSSAKVWLYLHGDRSPEELERIHAEQLGAPKKKRDKGAKRLKPKTSESKKNLNKRSLKPIDDSYKPSNETNSVAEEMMTSSHQKPSLNGAEATASLVVKSASVSSSKVNQPRTIQVTQKQLQEISRTLKEDVTSTSGRELVIMQSNLPKQTAPTQHPQPGLKLILKPTTGERPVAEVVRVMESNFASSNHGNQQVLSPDALRRLTEQLSAMSSRPIKIVQRNMTTTPTSSGMGSRVINITARPNVKSVPIIHNRTSSVLQTGIFAARTDQTQPVSKTVYISRVGGLTGRQMVPQSADEPRIVQIVQKKNNATLAQAKESLPNTKTVVVNASTQLSEPNIQVVTPQFVASRSETNQGLNNEARLEKSNSL